jgi:membrane fusion protein (multidrug efflux system)
MNGLVNLPTEPEFRAEFTNPEGLRSGSSGIIRLPIVQSNVILVPQVAAFEVPGKQIIYAVEQGNKVKSRIIETNGTSGLITL